jgi:hypothetical protein
MPGLLVGIGLPELERPPLLSHRSAARPDCATLPDSLDEEERSGRASGVTAPLREQR